MYDSMTINDLLDINVRRFPQKTALVYRARRITYSEMGRRINRLANNLLELGVGKGDRVGLYFYNCHNLVEAFFATLKIGAVAVPVNFRMHPHEVKWVLDKTRCSTLMYSERFSATINALNGGLGTARRIVYCGANIPAGAHDLESLCREGNAEPPGVVLNPDDWASLMFTGGTTGEPKAAIYTHRSYLWQCLINMLTTRLQSDEVYLNHPPLFHLAGMGQTLAVLAAGGSAIIVDTLNPLEILGLIQSERITFLYLVPPQLYRRLTEHPEIRNFDVSTITKVVTSAGGNSPDIVRSLYGTFPNLKLCLYGWGQTETGSGTVHELTADMAVKEPEKTQSVGRPIAFTDIRLVDDEGAEVPVGEMGEAIVRTPSSFIGYLDRPEL
ncbi:MAG TPA: class I adenylate-forming enzyme family protein, partial [Deltaproteobacteria bacterium]|nr:class I adenylate-forming enzyme family protein [Deltaproteobacteria bacterium]